MTRFRQSTLAPWTGLFAGAIAWALHHQLGSDLDFWDCTRGGPVLVVSLGLACGLLALAGGWFSWSARGPAGEDQRPDTRTFAAGVGAMGAGVFLLAILLQTAASLFVPGCHR
jgi:hypothetical protein